MSDAAVFLKSFLDIAFAHKSIAICLYFAVGFLVTIAIAREYGVASSPHSQSEEEHPSRGCIMLAAIPVWPATLSLVVICSVVTLLSRFLSSLSPKDPQ